MIKQYRDEIAMVCHNMMKDMYELGAVSDGEMREFEENCFASSPDSAKKPRKIREAQPRHEAATA
jgi:DNA-binding transcriptional regulator YiaG